jgi:hypothetical protein
MIVVITDNSYFYYIAKTVYNSLINNNYKCKLIDKYIKDKDHGIDTYIIFNVYSQSIPKNYILYNFEQLNVNYYNKNKFIDLVKNAKLILDYSTVNNNIWKIFNINSHYLPWNTTELLFNKNFIEKDIDILFVGTLNNRRKKILDEIDKKFNLVILTNVFGLQLESYMARTKICLNIHYYDKNSILEIPRIIPMINHHVKILSELSLDDYYCTQYNAYIKWFDYEDYKIINDKIEELIKLSIHFDNINKNIFDIKYNNINKKIEEVL